jgi:hypothetical protein
MEHEMLRCLVDFGQRGTLAAQNYPQLPLSVKSIIEIAKFSDCINEIDKNFQGSMFNIVALFPDFIFVLLQTVDEGLGKTELILEAEGIGIVQNPETTAGSVSSCHSVRTRLG